MANGREKQEVKHEIWELRQMQALPLDIKVKMTQNRIRDWYNYWGGEVYVSFSGGKDSTVLLDIVRNIYPGVEAVFVNTGLEYPEIQAFVKTFDNVKILYPKKTFLEVLTEYGYPVISKEISHDVSIAKRNPTGKVSRRFSITENRGQYSRKRFIPMLSVDFMPSERCCDIMKKSPSHQYAKESGKVAITAQMACESHLRTQKWLQNGCNAFETKNPTSNPMSFWTEQDVLHYIVEKGLKIAPVYGEIVPEDDQYTLIPDCKLKTTGCNRTGCVYCGFGCHLEKGQTRFQRLKITHPKQYDFCINGGQYNDKGLWVPSKEGLGLAHVFDELNKIYGENFIRYK